MPAKSMWCSFLELGGSSVLEPEAVARWLAEDALEGAPVSDSSPTSIRLVGQRKSCAWIELVVLEPPIKPAIHCAVPVALQIEVGKGSWESSLIQATTNDCVISHVVVVWSQ